MGIFTRMSNMVKAKVNTTLDEAENPIELLDQKLRDMDEQLSRAKLNSAQVLGNVHALEKNMNLAQKESADFEEKIKLALAKGNEELAKRALSKKVDSDKKYTTLKSTFETSKVQAETLKKNLRGLQDEIEKTRNYRDEAAARYSNAEASKTVNEILADVKTKSNTIQIDNIERNIAKKEALAQGLGDLREVDDFDSEFEKLDDVDLDSELDKYRTAK